MVAAAVQRYLQHARRRARRHQPATVSVIPRSDDSLGQRIIGCHEPAAICQGDDGGAIP